jgi:hypothetical protein
VLTSHDLLYTGRAELGAAPNDQQHERRTNRAEDVFGDLVAAGGALTQEDDSCSLNALQSVMLAASPQSPALTVSDANMAFEAVALLAALLAAGLTAGAGPPDVVKLPPELDEFPPPFARAAFNAAASVADCGTLAASVVRPLRGLIATQMDVSFERLLFCSMSALAAKRR